MIRGWANLMLVALMVAPAGSAALAPRGTPAGAAIVVSPSPTLAAPPTPTAPPTPSPSALEPVDTQVTRVLSLMESFIGWLGLLLAILGAIISVALGIAGWFGWSESRKIKDIRAKAYAEVNAAVATAQSAADAARRALDGTSAAQAEVNTAVAALQSAAADARHAAARALSDAEAAHAQLDRLRDAAQSAMKKVAAEFDELPRLEYGRDERAGPPAVPADVSLAFEEADILLVLCDRLDLLADREATSRYFVQIGRYWQVLGNYSRSLARLERAVANPGLPPVLLAEGRWQIGRTLLQQAAAGRLDATQRDIWLDRAEKEIEDAIRLLGAPDANTLHDLGSVRYQRGDFTGAAERIREARELEREWVARNGGTVDWTTTYNLARALAMAGHHDEALRELESIVDVPVCRDLARQESAFVEAWKEEPWCQRFRALVERR